MGYMSALNEQHDLIRVNYASLICPLDRPSTKSAHLAKEP